MKKLRFLQPNQIDAETLKDPAKLKAYFDWKYENFEEEYKIHCEEIRKLKEAFLDALPKEKREYYIQREEEYFRRDLEIWDRYEPVLNKAYNDNNIVIMKKALDEMFVEEDALREEYKDIDFMVK